MSEDAVVFVVDDDEGMRDSMSFVLKKADIPCKAFSSGKQALARWKDDQPNCIVIDFQMPDMTGLQLIREARESYGSVPFILVTGHGTVAMAVETMAMGAVTLIEKPFHHETFIGSVKTALELDQQRRKSEQEKVDIAKRMESLSAREREVAMMVADGLLTKQIAKSLGISSKTVEVHRSRVSKKLGVESVAQLVRIIMRSTVL